MWIRLRVVLFNRFAHSGGPGIGDWRIGVRCLLLCGSGWSGGSGWFGLELGLG